jgi:uncharacterized protein YjdB
MRPYCHEKSVTMDASVLRPNATRPYFKSTELATIYNFPSPNLSTNLVIGVISFGGGLVGQLSPSGVLINGDCQKHWDYLGIPSANFPQVILVPVSGATNQPNPSDAATIENTIDIQTIGAMCPSAKLTILLYLAPNSFNEFVNVLAKASTTTIIDGIRYTPSIISCSWGATETLYPFSILNSLNSQLQTLFSKGIPFTAATGDYGSSNGLSGTNCDFPSSSPYAIACGGTTLVCPNYTYDNATMEIGWTGGGGGISKIFMKPNFQRNLPGTGRNTPDIALVADPDTGVVFTIGNTLKVIGGTSIVSPAIAAYLAILNLNKVITPLLYTFPPSNFQDIVMGTNGEYVAKLGYDNCTGLGSIHGIRLANSLQGINTDIPVTGIQLNQSSLQLVVNTTATLVAIFVPVNATNQMIRWSSNNASVATVNNGRVTAITSGNAVITAMAADGGFIATCTVTVPLPNIPVTSITLTPSTMILGLKQTATLTATILPANATNKTLTWISSNPTIVSTNPRNVDSNSIMVTGNNTGNATITATCNSVQTTTRITVVSPIVSIRLVPASLLMTVGSSSRTSVIFQPIQSAIPITSWTSSNPAVATVDSNGIVRALKIGNARITGTVNDKTGTRIVTVR